MGDGPLSEQIYQMFIDEIDLNVIGIDVWNLPATYVNTVFRNNTGITYPLLVEGRSAGIAYNMETVSVPSPTDIEHRGHVIIDRQGVIRYYAIYDPFNVVQQEEMICLIKDLLDSPPLRPQNATISYIGEEGIMRLSWSPDMTTTCSLRYSVLKTLNGDWSDAELIGTTFETVYIIESLPDSAATFHVVSEFAQP